MAENNKVPTSPAQENKATMEIDQAVLKGILDSLESLKAQAAEKDEQIEILRDSVGRYKLEQAESKQKPAGVPTAKLMVFNGKPVIKFVMSKNKYVYNPLAPNTVAGEDLAVTLTYLDGSEEKNVPYGEFFRNPDRVVIEKVGEEDNEWVAEFVDKSISTEKITINTKYLNP